MKDFSISHAARADGTPAFRVTLSVDNNLRGNIAELITVTAHPGNENWNLLQIQELVLEHAIQQLQSELGIVQAARRQIADAQGGKST